MGRKNNRSPKYYPTSKNYIVSNKAVKQAFPDDELLNAITEGDFNGRGCKHAARGRKPNRALITLNTSGKRTLTQVTFSQDSKILQYEKLSYKLTDRYLILEPNENGYTVCKKEGCSTAHIRVKLDLEPDMAYKDYPLHFISYNNGKQYFYIDFTEGETI